MNMLNAMTIATPASAATTPIPARAARDSDVPALGGDDVGDADGLVCAASQAAVAVAAFKETVFAEALFGVSG